MPEKEEEKKAEKKEIIIKKSFREYEQKILHLSEISILLDNYDDIFSDFDPRPYSERSLSDDLLNEARKASRDKNTGRLELRFLISEKMRDVKLEATIKKRLHEHFERHSKILNSEIRQSRVNAVFLGFAGITVMLGATYVDGISGGFMSRFLFVLLEPAGWFITWFALDKLFYVSETKSGESDFYHKMSKCEVIFASY
ncbi:MAG TPA: hypothetical protein VI564_06595 [Candidatus Nanoarchaeia archaeon]|nr:hypothetical protein [Candidatus Nanoarchaeia archaeon]